MKNRARNGSSGRFTHERTSSARICAETASAWQEARNIPLVRQMEAQMADMATHYGWWILAVVLGITELFVGSFYLLVIAVALALAGLSAWLGHVQHPAAGRRRRQCPGRRSGALSPAHRPVAAGARAQP